MNLPGIELMPTPPVSPTLAADALVGQLRAEGKPIYHMGFGQAPFPAPDRLAAALRDTAHHKAYLPVAGLPELRTAVASYHARLTNTDAEATDVLIAPGSKLILYAAQMAIRGDLLLPAPSWVSYEPQADMLGQRTTWLPVTLNDEGYHLDAGLLEQTVLAERKAGRNPTKLLLNYPNNPTGLTMPQQNLLDIAKVCQALNLIIISDEIYGRLAFDGQYRSISSYAPERTIVTSGLSKHASLGGWRLGIGLIPKTLAGADSSLFATLSAIASETWSCVTAPVQLAAIEAYQHHDDIEAFIATSTRIHKDVTAYLAQRLNAMGLPTPIPQGGFYAWPDFGKARSGILSSPTTLTKALLEEEGIVALPSSAFGIATDRLCLRLSACDYDGADALNAYQGLDAHDSAPDLASFAPRVPQAMNALQRFVERQCQT